MYHPICMMREERKKKSLEISRGNIHAICDHLLIEMSHFNEDNNGVVFEDVHHNMCEGFECNFVV